MGGELSLTVPPTTVPSKKTVTAGRRLAVAPRVQTKLVVGATTDPHEREADDLADLVVRSLQRPDRFDAGATPAATRIRRTTAAPPAPGDAGVQRDTQPRIVRREPSPAVEAEWVDVDDADAEQSAHDATASDETDDDKDEQTDDNANDAVESTEQTGAASDTVQRAAVAQHDAPPDTVGRAGGDVPSDVAAEIATARGGGRPLGGQIRSDMEQSFGADLGGVRIHEGARADRLNRSLGARAFTVGSDVFFAQREFAPQAEAGQHLLAHELAHVVQQGSAGRSPARRSTVIRREFTAHTVLHNAHLRDDTSWSKKKGPRIDTNDVIFVDDANTKRKDARDRIARTKGQDVRWSAALNVPPGHVGPISAKRAGFIRSTRVQKQNGATLVESLKTQVVDILRAGERLHPGMVGLFVRPGEKDFDEQIDFLMKKHLRVGILGGFQGANPEQAAQAISMTATRLERVRTGVQFLADSLDHWRTWLHPTRAAEVTITGLKWKQSDLHQRGLGVVKVDFQKPVGGAAAFSNQTAFSVMVKPEDKSLEQALLGENEQGADDDEDGRSAAQKINEIVGLDTADEALTTIKMASDEHYGAIIEFVNGKSARKFLADNGATAVKQTFHETLVFAFLAGLDDLHRDNVFWSHDGRPFLIDADNVLSMNQMLQKDNGAKVQSGFGYDKDDKGQVHAKATAYHQEAQANMKAIRDEDQTFNSKILAAMLTDVGKRTEIVDALREALEGKKARIVPVRTQYWGDLLNTYPSHEDTNSVLDQHANQTFIVEGHHPTEDRGQFDARIGPGFMGMVGENDDDPDYVQAEERAQQKSDFESGVIPFYEYEFSTGKVFHNGQVVYHGTNALDAAMDVIDTKFPATLI